ncbi:MAG: valine--tRNA ligase [Phycisphaerales bacterium JB037]
MPDPTTADAPARGEMPKQYRPSDHEARIRGLWESARCFHADPGRVLAGRKPPYCILIPPPNVTAVLHLGHALNNTLQDVLARAHRMKGFETLWMPGTDHAGIAPQAVVERRLMQSEGKKRTDYARADFVAKVQEFKDEYEARITEQLKRMGCSCDYDRQRFTMDEVCARAVREAFFRLFRDGLIYRGKRLVNWDPVLQTAIADDEVENRDIEGIFAYLRYPLVHPPSNPHDPKDVQEVTWSELARRGYPGASEMPEDANAWITVATTRPETYLGDTGVAINPHDPRAKPLEGLMVQLPIVGRIVRIVEDDYVVLPVSLGGDENDPKARMATGFLKVTPAHDPNDYEIGRRHDLEIINVMALDASISESHGWDRAARGEGGHVFVGKSREEARKLVLREFEARQVSPAHAGLGTLLEKVVPHHHSVGHSDRSKVPIEPYLSDQWFVRVTDDRMRGNAQRALNPEQRSAESLAAWPASKPKGATDSGDGSMTIHPSRYAKTYETWHDNLRDWCISRQLWWGHRIPVWRAHLDHDGMIGILNGEEPYTFGQLVMEEENPACILSAHYEGSDHVITGHRKTPDFLGEALGAAETEPILWSVCPQRSDIDIDGTPIEQWLEEHGFERDPDVLDTWFSSALWPMSTMGWPGVPDAPSADTLAPGDPHSVRSIFVKRVGTWKSFVGQENEHSGDLIERLLTLRDMQPRAPIVYELFSERDLLTPLVSPDVIQETTDLVCAVGVRTRNAIRTEKYGSFDPVVWLRSHGFVESGTAQLHEAFTPTSVLSTGRDIMTLWVSRMVMFNRYLLGNGQSAMGNGQEGEPGPVPFRDVFIHAMIQDGQGRKMSKSLGNGLDPLDIIDSHGADAMRFTLCHMTTQTQDVRMPVEPDPETGLNTSPKFDLGRNFANKLWNAARFALGILEKARPASFEPGDLTLADRWMLSKLRDAIGQIDRAIERYEFSAYATGVYDLLWRDFCDWYLESVKPTARDNPSQQAVLRATLDAILRVLHPVCPFVTEAIAEPLRTVQTGDVPGLELQPSTHDGLLCRAGWPIAHESLYDPEAEASYERVRTLVGAIREVRAQHQVPPKRMISLHLTEALEHDLASAGAIDLVCLLAGVDAVKRRESDPGEENLVEFPFEQATLALGNLRDAVDAGAERARLEKHIDQLQSSIAALEKRLSNPGYTDKAPAHLVQQTRDELDSTRGELAASLEALERLR